MVDEKIFFQKKDCCIEKKYIFAVQIIINYLGKPIKEIRRPAIEKKSTF